MFGSQNSYGVSEINYLQACVRRRYIVVRPVEPDVPGHVEGRHEDDDEKDNVAKVEQGQVHRVGGNGTLVHVVRHLQINKDIKAAYHRRLPTYLPSANLPVPGPTCTIKVKTNY